MIHNQWWIQDFPEEGRQLPGGVSTNDFAKISQKCMKLKEFGPGGGERERPLRPLRSATDNTHNQNEARHLFWISGNVCLILQSQGDSSSFRPYSLAMEHVMILRVTS